MQKRSVIISIVVLLVVCCAAAINILLRQTVNNSIIPVDSHLVSDTETTIGSELLEPLPSPNPTTIQSISPKKTLFSDYHVFQTFNNCGPAALSMALRYYGINKAQQELGADLRPYQHPTGDNDDKSVTLQELATYAENEYDLVAFRRPNGNTEILEQLIAADVPVITRTLLTDHDDIGHFRIIKGYDQSSNTLIQDDSLQGKNLTYSYQDFNTLWQPFNYEYLVLVPKDKVTQIESILGENADEQRAWQNAVVSAQTQLQENPNDIYAQLNLSTALYMTGAYEESIKSFESVQDRLPKRTLWYQIEPIEAYYQVGKYDKVLALTESILNNQNRAFTELYILRGKVFVAQNQPELAKNEFEKAVQYNSQNAEAKKLLSDLQS